MFTFTSPNARMKNSNISLIPIFHCADSIIPIPADPCSPDCSDGGRFYPHPRNCTLYYQCSNGVPYLEQCPLDLYFNPIYLVCDHPADAGCLADPDYNCTDTTISTSSSTASTTEISETTTSTTSSTAPFTEISETTISTSTEITESTYEISSIDTTSDLDNDESVRNLFFY